MQSSNVFIRTSGRKYMEWANTVQNWTLKIPKNKNKIKNKENFQEEHVKDSKSMKRKVYLETNKILRRKYAIVFLVPEKWERSESSWIWLFNLIAEIPQPEKIAVWEQSASNFVVA